MNNCFINITKNLDLKILTVSNASDIDEITTSPFNDHIIVCKVKEAYIKILREDVFSFKIVSTHKVTKVVLKLCKYPKTNYRGSFGISEKHY